MEVDEDENRSIKSPLEPVTKKLQLQTRGRVFGVIRESYLRTDIACRSELCFEACSHKTEVDEESKKLATLPSDTTHYLIPFTDVATKFMEVIEFEELSGLIFPQTVVNEIQQSSLKHYRRICGYIRNLKNRSVFFPNEFFKPTYLQREASESIKDWQYRMIYQVGVWYYEHLGAQMPIVLVSEDSQIIEKFGHLKVEVFVMSLGDYLQRFWPSLTRAISLHKELVQAASVPEGKVEGYFEYFKPEIVESGLKSGRFVSGRLSVNKHLGQTEAFVSRNSKDNDKGGGGDVLVWGEEARNRAVDGDVVVVELLPRGEWRSRTTHLVLSEEEKDSGKAWSRGADVMATGRVVAVLERGWRDYIATLPKQDEDSMDKAAGKRILVYPYDRRIPKIRIVTSQAKVLQGSRIIVRIDNWPVGSQYPQGHFVKCLGRVGDLETEIDTILTENAIEVVPFSQGILGEHITLEAAKSWLPDPEEIAKRRDLRSTLVMSIDPRGCEDVDDAISIKKLDNGNLQVGVHIADVTHFVKPGGLTDLEARKRATTVYLADRRYDMLPPVLSAQLCSLLGGVERYAVSCIWEIHPQTFKVKEVWYGRTVIKSAYKLCYEHAQDIIDGKSSLEMQKVVSELSDLRGKDLNSKYSELKEALTILSKVARKWQGTRQKEGALNLESTEVQFEFEERNVDSIKPKEHLEIHETVAECMIMANHWVARKIAEVWPSQALLRLHPPPKKENFEQLLACAASRGWSVNTSSNKALAESLNRCVDTADGTVNMLLRSLATLAMVQAVYFSTGSVLREDWVHYGLALDRYTHFTSPIRRYADVLVHRLLLAAVAASDWWAGEGNSAGAQLLNNKELADLSSHINNRNRAAQRAQRDSQTLFQTLYFRNRPLSDPRCVVDAVIFSLKENGFIVYIPVYAIKGPVYLENKNKEVLYCGRLGPVWQRGLVTKREAFVKVETIEGTNMYRLFEHITVGIQLKGSEAHAHKLDLSLLEKAPWSGSREGEMEGDKFNFLRAAREEQEEMEKEAEKNEGEEEELPGEGKRKKQKINVYDFFQEMRNISVRPLSTT